jgi:hypothetical protein
VARELPPGVVGGYLDRSGAYGSAGGVSSSDGVVEVVFAPEGRDNSPLTEQELGLVQLFLDNEPKMSAAVKTAVFERYEALRELYGYTAEEQAEFMPDLAGPEDLRRLIGLHSVHVHQISHGAAPYVGFEFGCTWDDEHGLGVLMHGERCVEMGGADHAFLLWIAKQDAQRGQ